MLERSPPSNPFSTRFTRPGKLPYRFAGNEGTERLLHELVRQHWWGAIVGPHGTGKTTLLQSLIPRMKHYGRTVCQFTLHAGERNLPAMEDRYLLQSTQVIVDGFEQLGWLGRRAIWRRCRKHGMGLLVTSHHSTKLPGLILTATSLDILQQLVEHLQRNAPVRIDRANVATCYHRHDGNIRDTLFALYDLYERMQCRTGL